jgi:hypothetical protein
MAQTNLAGATVYLSGPMDFLAAPRAQERLTGWRTRVGQFLERREVTVLDPWHKPQIRGLHDYGKEDDTSTELRNSWNFDDTSKGTALRAEICSSYWPFVHIDLRMVDKSDFLIAFCPTNTYSVGTVHEIALARQQYKPVLFVSPPIPLLSLATLREHLEREKDARGIELLDQLLLEQPMKKNPNGAPSMWYMGLLDSDYFFDGFGFNLFQQEFAWPRTALDDLEEQFPPKRPLLPYLVNLEQKIPERHDHRLKRPVTNDDWLLFEKKVKLMGE